MLKVLRIEIFKTLKFAFFVNFNVPKIFFKNSSFSLFFVEIYGKMHNSCECELKGTYYEK